MTPIVSAVVLRTQSDARLLELAREGQERAFEAIVERYRKPLLRSCRRVVPEPRAEDAVQQAFLKAWSSIQRGTEVEEVRPWLYRIARNAALDAVNQAGYDYSDLTEALEMSPAPEIELERRWVVRETLGGIAALPDHQREALLRTVVEGHSGAEIARDLQISEGAVRQLVLRARTTLRAAASAITPMPLVNWAASLGGSDAPLSARIAELTAGGGATGGAALLLKSGTAVVAAGALMVGTGSQVERSAPPANAETVSKSPRHATQRPLDEASATVRGRGHGSSSASAPDLTSPANGHLVKAPAGGVRRVSADGSVTGEADGIHTQGPTSSVPSSPVDDRDGSDEATPGSSQGRLQDPDSSGSGSGDSSPSDDTSDSSGRDSGPSDDTSDSSGRDSGPSDDTSDSSGRDSSTDQQGPSDSGSGDSG